jgi:hypothetical protein
LGEIVPAEAELAGFGRLTVKRRSEVGPDFLKKANP